MKKTIHIVVPLLFIMLQSTVLRAQYAATRLYTVEDGLPITECHTVYVDPRGLLHVSYSSPLEVWAFDGQRFFKESFMPPQSSRMQEDDQGRLWMFDLEVLAYTKGDTLVNWVIDDRLPLKDTLRKEEKIPQLYPAFISGQAAVFTTHRKDEAKLYTFDPIQQTFIAIDSIHKKSDYINYRYAEPESHRYIIHAKLSPTKFTFWLKENGTLKFIGSDQSPEAALGKRWLHVTGTGQLLLMDGGRFSIWSIEDHRLRSIEGPIPISEILPANSSFYLSGLKNRSLIMGAGNEKYLIVFKEAFTSYDVIRFYHPSNIIQFDKDLAGNFWAAGHSGLLRIFPAFTNFFQENNQQLLTDIHSLGQDGQDNIWVGSFGQGMGYFTPKDDFINNGTDFPKILPGSISPFGHDLLFSSSSPSAGLIHLQKGRFRMVYPALQGYFFTRNNEGQVLFGSNKEGLFIHKNERTDFGPDAWNSAGPERGLKLINILTAIQDAHGHYWMGRPSKGIAVYLPETDTIYNYLIEDQQIGFGVWSSVKDHRGNMWLGTTRGLRRFTPPSEINDRTDLQSYFEEVGASILDTAQVRSLALYRNQYLVFLADASLALLDLSSYYQNPEHPIIHEFNEANGYQGLNGEQNAIWIDRQERIWFANDKGVTRFNPAFFQADTLPIRVVIDQLSSYGDNFSVTQAPMLSLEQKHTNVRFSFHIEDNPTLASNIHFLYSLNEGDLRTTTDNTVEFINQQYGLHTFTVYAVKNGVRSLPVSVDFEIPQSFAETPAFYMLLAGTFIGLISIFYIGKRRQDKRRQELAMLRAQTIVNQLNPHFINNALGWIQYRAKNTGDNEAMAVIQRMAYNIKMIFRNSREKKSHHPLRDELRIVENYFHIQRARFGEDFHFEIPAEKQLASLDLSIHVPMMILQIHCENAVEHGIRNQNGAGYIRLDVYDEGVNLKIVIEDNGVGRKKAAEIGSLGFGQGTKMMAELTRAFNLDNRLKIRQYFEDDIFTKPDGTVHGTRSIILIPKYFNYESATFLRTS